MRKQRGFTLIELLVVVLIIGILAAVALPQYDKAVEKSKLAEGMLWVKNLGNAVDAYMLADPNGKVPSSLADLDVGLPDNAPDSTACSTVTAGLTLSGCKQVSKEWAVGKMDKYIFAVRLTGKYANKGGVIYYKGSVYGLYNLSVSETTTYCKEMLGQTKKDTFAAPLGRCKE